MAKGDRAELERIVRQLWELFPPRKEERTLGHRSVGGRKSGLWNACPPRHLLVGGKILTIVECAAVVRVYVGGLTATRELGAANVSVISGVLRRRRR